MIFISAPASFGKTSLVSRGIPVIGFGPGEAKLAHIHDERCPADQILEACAFYAKVIELI